MQARVKLEKDKSKAEDQKLSLFIMAYFLIQVLNDTIKTVFPISDQMWSALSNGFMYLLIILMLFVLPSIFKNAGSVFIIAEIILLLLLLYSNLVGNINDNWTLYLAMRILGIFFPLGICAYCIKNYSVFMKTAYKLSFIISAFIVFALIFGVGSDYTYSMSLAYALILPIFFHIQHYFDNKRKVILVVIIVVEVVVTFFYGSRGPLVCIAAYCLWLYFMRKRRVKLHTLILSTFVIAALVVLLIYYDVIISTVITFLNQHDIYSRTLTQINLGNFFVSKSRDLLRIEYWQRISEKPVLGWGLGGGWLSRSMYPHNIFQEILLSFGMVFGSFILIALAYLYIRSLVRVKTDLDRMTALFGIASLQLFMSGTFLLTPVFYIFVILACKKVRNNRKKLDLYANKSFKKHQNPI